MRLAAGLLVAAASGALAAGLGQSPAPAVYVFGDSLSDIGALKSLSGGLVPPAPYWEGRFTSGPLWNEYLARLLGYSLRSLATAGSTIDGDFSALLDTIAAANGTAAVTLPSAAVMPARPPPLLDLAMITNIVPGLTPFVAKLLGVVPGPLDFLSDLLNAVGALLGLPTNVDLVELLRGILDALRIAVPGINNRHAVRPHNRPLSHPRITVPSTHDQIDYFRASVPGYAGSQNSHYDIAILAVGTTDMLAHIISLQAGTETAEQIADTLAMGIISQLSLLRSIGFRNIVVVDMLPLHHTPLVTTLGAADLVRPVVSLYNQKLAASVAGWASGAQDLNMATVAELGAFIDILLGSSAALEALGVTDTAHSCILNDLTGLIGAGLTSDEFAARVAGSLVCSDPSASFFFDAVHPGERIHRLFGYYAAELIYARVKGRPFALCETTLLGIIQKYSLGTPAPKPATV
ncbi:hypothetical protein H4R19_000406 [Coemansia spiralis]|nr:hypothetical protein H4R19_000406 [Coemansia spiralis]